MTTPAHYAYSTTYLSEKMRRTSFWFVGLVALAITVGLIAWVLL